MTRFEAVAELKRVFATLNADLEASLELGKTDSSQFAHRTLIRTYFAFVEGVASQLRQVTLATLDGTEFLSHAEAALLREERSHPNSKGEPETRENFQSILPNLLFSIRCYVKNHGVSAAVVN